MRRLSLLAAAICVILLGTSCRQAKNVTPISEGSRPTPSPSPMLAAPEITVTQFLMERDQVRKPSQSALLRAWKTIPGWNHYRLARSTDFNMPDWVQKDQHLEAVEREVRDPYEEGEMAGAQGLAAIFIDKTISDAKKYSCVLFISRPASRYDVYWIFKNEDLSRFIVARHSGDVYLDEYREDGSSRVCDIRYSSKQKRWACEFY